MTPVVVGKVDVKETSDRITDSNFQSLNTSTPVIDATKED